MVKKPPANAEDVNSISGREEPLEEGIATHSSTLAWQIPWTEEFGVLQPTGLQSQTWLRNQPTATKKATVLTGRDQHTRRPLQATAPRQCAGWLVKPWETCPKTGPLLQWPNFEKIDPNGKIINTTWNARSGYLLIEEFSFSHQMTQGWFHLEG